MRRLLAALLTSATLAAGALAACSGDGPTTATAPSDAGVDRAKVAPTDPDSAPAPVVGPTKLSETGLYSDIASRTIAPGLIAYTPRYELWSDGAAKKRWLHLPPGTKIDTSSMGAWSFPVGTRAWKEFSVNGLVVETRFLWKARADAWFEVAYVWTPDGSDALAAPKGDANALDAGHEVPNQTQCNDCHFNVTDTLIGVSAIQLSSGGNGLLTTLAKQGQLTVDPGREFEIPGDGGVKDALAYLHANCGHCHNDVGHLQMQTALHLDVDPADPTVESTGAYSTAFHLVMRHTTPNGLTETIVPGDPGHSGLLWRMSVRDGTWQMPPLGTKVVDEAGVKVVGDWIGSLPP